MERVNFYQLLELKINPPENNTQIIEDAIKKKQSEWSRLRNHPTKGIQARQYISLLPEIRKVMTDSELRQREAQAAVEALKKKLESIFKAVDRHIDLIGSKGQIQAEETARIAAHHEIRPQLVQKRVERWRKRRGSPAVIQIQHQLINGKLTDPELEKIAQQNGIEPDAVRKIHQQLLDQRLSELDEFVSIQVRKGYMTQAEISGLAAVFPFDEGEILRRIRCPIKKSAKKEETETHLLDSTVEQVIQENLKIVGHDSLYSFLGLFPGSNLEALQKKTDDKENDIRKISQKDAVLTASGVLVGQCIALFKSDESRYAYDLSRARLLLKKLNADIDLAVTNDTIPLGQYNYLVRQAVRFGTLPEEAQKHIRDYCQSKGWTVVKPKKQINVKRYLAIATVVLLVVGIGSGAFWFFYYGQQRLETEYINMRAEAGRQPNLEAQKAYILKYLKRLDNEGYREKAQQDIAAVEKQIEYRDLKRVQKKKAELASGQKYEEVAQVIKRFTAKHPQSAHNQGLKQELASLPDLIDKRDFNRITALPPKNYRERALAMSLYLREHPKGAHVGDVKQLARQTAQPYYQQLSRALKNCEKSQQWQQCIELSTPFIDLYKDSEYAVRLRKKRDDYIRNTQGQEIMTALRAKAGGPAADPAQLQKVYRDYLRQTPYSPARTMITAELQTLDAALNRRDAQAELARVRKALIQSNGRFIEKVPATLFDQTTGLTWAMIDSHYDRRECLSYDDAIQYANRLKTGEFSDWRLPTIKELESLYGNSDILANKAAPWYWSADKIRRYSGGWIILVDVYDPANGRVIKQRNAADCGWVRPVRR